MKNMSKRKFVTSLIFFCAYTASAVEIDPDFRTGIIGTSFITNQGSSLFDYKVLINFRVHGRHRVELKFVERNSADESELSKIEQEELVMVNCTLRTYTTSIWESKKANANAVGHRRYVNGDAMKWEDTSDDSLAPGVSDSSKLPRYLKMICDSL